jgi:hypothetical protein
MRAVSRTVAMGIQASTEKQLIDAGRGKSSERAEVDALDAGRVDAVVGMAVYSQVLKAWFVERE